MKKMEKLNLFDFDDYKTFLKTKIENEKGFRGYQSQMAVAAGCQRSFLSQVLNSSMELTREHASGLARFFNFGDLETEFFLTLVDLARAGTSTLKQYTAEKLENLRKKKKSFVEQIKKRETVDDDERRMTYYSSWYWSAIHILLSIPQYRSPHSIAERLHLPLELVKHTLLKLQAMGLAERENNIWSIGNRDIHISDNSPMAEMNHMHWRQRAQLNVQLKDREAFHYTSVFSLSRHDADQIRTLIMEAMAKSRKMVPPSKEEEIFCLTCDFFKV